MFSVERGDEGLVVAPTRTAKHTEPATTDHRNRHEALTGAGVPDVTTGNMHVVARLVGTGFAPPSWIPHDEPTDDRVA